MATTISISGGSQTAKLRSPWGVVGLSLITLGVYYWVWYFKINREMRDLGRARNVNIGDSPGTSLAAITIGACVIIPVWVSLWNTGKRMELAQQTVGAQGGSGGMWFLLHFIPLVSIYAPVYMQKQLNLVWETQSRMQPAVGEPDLAAA